MRFVCLAFGFVFLAAAQSQQYVISTVAGGFLLPSTPALAVNSTIGQPHAIAKYPAGNVYFASLYSPLGLKVTGGGDLYIADGTSIRMVSAGGIITTVTGRGIVGNSGDGGLANGAQTGAWGLTFDSAGNLYIADPWNNAVRLLKPVESPVR